MSELWVWVTVYGVVVFACVLLPVIGMAALVPTLRTGRLRVSNYRGVQVTPGLGIVWVWWVAGFVLMLLSIVLLSGLAGIDLESFEPTMTQVLGVFLAASIAVIPAFVFGMIDDVFDAGTDKGFKGHLGAMRSLRLTTGLLKMVGIGIAALLVAAGLSLTADDGHPVLGLVVRALVIALGANTLNLFDLRPGRALKIYGAGSLVIAASIPLIWELGALPQGIAASGAIALGLLGPLLAVWRFDLREIGMLGDAGSNPAGVLLGVLVAALWPLGAISVLAALLVGLNLLAEWTSLSEIIENNAVLSRVDRIGRLDLDAQEQDPR